MSDKVTVTDTLFLEVRKIIEEGKQQVAQAVNVGLSATYWHIGKRINEDVLENKRADYGKQVVATYGMFVLCVKK